MPGPIFWIIVTLSTVLLCTAHLLAGIWIGRELFGQRALRRAAKALSVGVAQAQAQEDAADFLLQHSMRLVARADSLPADVVLAQDASAVHQAASKLREMIQTGKEACRDAAEQISCKRAEPEQPVAAAKQETTVEVDASTQQETTVEVDASTQRTDDTPEVTTNPAESNETGSELPPWSSLSPDEVERFRTGFPTRDNAERLDTRYPYGVTQFVAPVHGNTFPQPLEFQKVKCRDVSCRGVSYFSPSPPDSDQVILTLGGVPNLSFVCSRITNHRESDMDDETGYIVGCEFVARLAPGVYCWNPRTRAIESAGQQSALEVLAS
jgi:hypothetical protein